MMVPTRASSSSSTGGTSVCWLSCTIVNWSVYRRTETCGGGGGGGGNCGGGGSTLSFGSIDTNIVESGSVSV